MLAGRSMRTRIPDASDWRKSSRSGRFDADDPGSRESVGDRDRLAGHQPAAADRQKN